MPLTHVDQWIDQLKRFFDEKENDRDTADSSSWLNLSSANNFARMWNASNGLRKKRRGKEVAMTPAELTQAAASILKNAAA